MLFPILKPVLVAFIAIVTYNLSGQIITEKEYLNRPHFEITTQTATYLFDRAGGGFSSIKDKEELEWIGFKPGNGSVPGSAAADFRGLPNLVFRGNDNGAGHPGFEKCNSNITGANQITTTSESGLWKWVWTFLEYGALLEILQTDTTRNYWFLYEGTPAGKFDPPRQYWGNNVDGKRFDTPPIGSDQTGNGQWRWAFFGHKAVARTLYIIHLATDPHNDTFSYMGSSDKGIESENGMVVFGFGRIGAAHLMSGSNRFFIGFYDSSEKCHPLFAGLEHHIKSVLYKLNGL